MVAYEMPEARDLIADGLARLVDRTGEGSYSSRDATGLRMFAGAMVGGLYILEG